MSDLPNNRCFFELVDSLSSLDTLIDVACNNHGMHKFSRVEIEIDQYENGVVIAVQEYPVGRRTASIFATVCDCEDGDGY